MATKADVIEQLLKARNAVEVAIDFANKLENAPPPDVVEPPPPPPPPADGKITRVTIAVRGQSNGYMWKEFGADTLIADTVRGYTGVDVQIVHRQHESPNTIFSGTSTARWMANNQAIAKECGRGYAMADSNPDNPMFDVVLHWEGDLRETFQGDTYADWHMQVRNTIRDMAPKKADGKYVTLLVHCPYPSAINKVTLRKISETWIDETKDPSILLGVGNGLDADHQGDWSHWTRDGARRVARLVAIRIARIMYDRGWTTKDLSKLSNLGPYIYKVEKSGAQRVTAYVRPDQGSRLVLPGDWGANGADVFSTTSGGNSRSVSINSDGNLDIQFSKTVNVGDDFLAYNHPWFFEGKIIYDNSAEKMPLQRTFLPIKVVAAAGSGNPTPPVTPTPTPPSSDGLTAAKNFVKDIALGDNVERGRIWQMKYNGEDIRNSSAYYAYRKSIGFDCIRLFYGWRPTHNMLGEGHAPPNDQQMDRLLNAARFATEQGHPVFLDACDVMDGDDLKDWNLVAGHIDRMAKRIAGMNFDPRLLCFGPFNELAFEQNSECNIYRIEAHKIIRRHLPIPYPILHGAANWNHFSRLDDKWEMPPDQCIIAQFHCYEGADNLGHWQWIQGICDEFSQRNAGIPVVGGEIGLDDFQHMGYSLRWLNHLKNVAEGAYRTRGMLWATTDGNDFRLSRGGDDARIRPELESAIREANRVIRSKPDWNRV